MAVFAADEKVRENNLMNLFRTSSGCTNDNVCYYTFSGFKRKFSKCIFRLHLSEK